MENQSINWAVLVEVQWWEREEDPCQAQGPHLFTQPR